MNYVTVQSVTYHKNCIYLKHFILLSIDTMAITLRVICVKWLKEYFAVINYSYTIFGINTVFIMDVHGD
jgi:hypothetical protein